MFRLILLVCLSGSAFGQEWQQLQGIAHEISAKGKELWVVNQIQQVFRYDTSKKNTSSPWTQFSGVGATSVGASADGWTWITNAAQQVYRYNPDKKVFELMPGNLVQISAMSKDKALGIGQDGGIWLYENGEWKRQPGAAIWAAIGEDDDRWVCNNQHSIFHWNHDKNQWDNVVGFAWNVEVQNAQRVVVANKINELFLYKGGVWEKLNGKGIKAAVNDNTFFAVNAQGQIWVGGDGTDDTVIAVYKDEPKWNF